MTLCLIGGSGFIGTALARQLTEEGRPFRIIDLVESPVFPEKTHIHDIREPLPANLLAGVTGIIHLAAVHRDDIRDPTLYAATNVVGTANVCAAAVVAGINHIVFTSSVAVYGFAPKGTDETGVFAPFNEYGRTKKAGEDVLREWLSEAAEDRTLVLIRPTVVFGPGNRGNVYNLLRQVSSGKFVMIGDGSNRKSMAYVENVAAFLAHTSKSDVFGVGQHIYNYIDKPDFDMNTLVSQIRFTLQGKVGVGPRLPVGVGKVIGQCFDLLATLTGRTFPISTIRVTKFTSESTFSSAAHDVPGFTAPVPFRDGLAKTLEIEFLSDTPVSPVFFTE